MSDYLYGKPVDDNRGVQDRLKLFPEVHMYKSTGKAAEVRRGGPAPPPAEQRKGREEGKPKRTVERVFITVILFLLFVLVAELCFHFIISPKLMIKKIVVRRDEHLSLSDSEILRIAGQGGDLFYFSVNTGEITERLQTYPLIKEAKVEKKFPDSLMIELSGRTPLAMSIVDTEEGGVPVVFDDEGVVFEIGTSVRNMDGPVLSGVVFKNIKLGMQLPVELLGLLESLKKLKNEAPELFRLISEVEVLKRSGHQFESVLYLNGFEMPVRTGMSLDKQQLTYILMVLDVVTRDELKQGIQELDLRNGEIVYKVKGAGDGE